MSDNRKLTPQKVAGKIPGWFGFTDAILRRYEIKRASKRQGLVYLNIRSGSAGFITKMITVSVPQVYKVNNIPNKAGLNHMNNIFINIANHKIVPKIKIAANIHLSGHGAGGQPIAAVGFKQNHNIVSRNNIMVSNNMLQPEITGMKSGFMMAFNPIHQAGLIQSGIFMKPIIRVSAGSHTESLLGQVAYQTAAQLTSGNAVLWSPLVLKYDFAAPGSEKLTNMTRPMAGSRLDEVQTHLKNLQERSVKPVGLHNQTDFGLTQGMHYESYQPVQAGTTEMIHEIRTHSGNKNSLNSIFEPGTDSGYKPSVPIVETYKSINTWQNDVAPNNKPAFSSGEINQLADQVYRQLEHRLLLERQRRGL